MITVRRSENLAFGPRVSAKVTEPRAPGGIGTTSKKKTKDKDEFVSQSAGIPISGMGPNTSVSQNPLSIDLDPMLTGLTPQIEQAYFHRLYRDIYYQDPVAGSAVDMISSLPFSEFSLGGITSPSVTNTFMETIERLNLRTMLPEMCVDYLVLGQHVSSLLFNKEKRVFTDIMPHAIENLTIESLPFYSQDPIITAKFPDSVRAAMAKDSPRIKRLREHIGRSVVDKIASGQLELDPLSTLYIPRKTFSHTDLGTSYYRRILPIYLIEKNLFRGTLVESARRQRGIMHITLGDGDQWEPSVADMEFITELFMNADSDPLGAIIATRLGVATEELRQGGDFWKSTDFADSVLGHKTRALGISEGFLSGEANYNCVIGKTFIQSERGLLKVGEIADRRNGKVQDFTLKVNSRYGKENCAKWLYSGKAPTLEVTAYNGASLTGTPKHRMLKLTDVLDTDWVYLKDVKIGDWAAIQTKPMIRKTRLKLKLSNAIKVHKGVRKGVVRPKHMTPALAYIIGCILAEGTLTNERIYFPNTDVAYLDKFAEYMQSVFGLEGNRYLQMPAGHESIINGVETATTKDYFASYFNSRTVVAWLNELGLASGTNSHTKTMPWSILQADGESQCAFLAAYLEGDGSIHKHDGRIMYASRSTDILEGLFAILQSHGINAKLRERSVSLHALDSMQLYEKVKTYMVTKSYDYTKRAYKNATSFGIPSEFIRNLLKSRRLRHDNTGCYFTDDDGLEVKVVGYKRLGDRTLMYDAFDSGKYDTLLQHLKVVSISAYNKLMELFKQRYNFVQITSIRDAGKQHVYDLSMRLGAEPAYVANGFVSHNTADASLTVFIDMLRSFREMFTRKLFYNKIFPLVSMLNGYTVNARGKMSIKDGLMDSMSPEDALFKMNDGSKLLIPSVSWAKQLKPEGDSAYLDMLKGMTDLGVPVPLRVLAAAGGLNIEEVMRSQEDDLVARKNMAEYIKKIKALTPQPAQGDDSAEASALLTLASEDPTGRTRSAVHALGGKIPLLARDFGASSEIVGRSKTGKKRVVHNQSLANERLNRHIARALVNADKRGVFRRTTVPLKEN